MYGLFAQPYTSVRKRLNGSDGSFFAQPKKGSPIHSAKLFTFLPFVKHIIDLKKNRSLFLPQICSQAISIDPTESWPPSPAGINPPSPESWPPSPAGINPPWSTIHWSLSSLLRPVCKLPSPVISWCSDDLLI